MRARRRVAAGTMAPEELEELLAAETARAVEAQERHGIDLIVNGEFSRDNYVSFVADRLDGVSMMSMAQMLPYIEDKKAFEQILDTLDVPAAAIKNAICTGPIARTRPIVAHEMCALKELTGHPIKATLPGPYLMTRSMWLPALSGTHYPDKQAEGAAVIEALIGEIAALAEAGVDVVQFDEPVLTEVVFTEGKPRSFMCAALSERKDPTEELAFAASLLKPVFEAVAATPMLGALHVCRGNWSRDESILLEGPYTPLLGVFEEAHPDALLLEFSTPRAGELASLFSSETVRRDMILGLGVQNPRLDVVESEESIIARAEEALTFVPPERLWLNPDCGFATFANRPVSTPEVIGAKMDALVGAARELRRRHG
jgi:5-methyltetrahydropteroyltriglutamate--homocysteine methyltransferase